MPQTQEDRFLYPWEVEEMAGGGWGARSAPKLSPLFHQLFFSVLFLPDLVCQPSYVSALSYNTGIILLPFIRDIMTIPQILFLKTLRISYYY